ncbi:hypothetical protein E4U55_006045 [Claviceps digitariae]|nr:hypothetical protein E4U55_006045 [Claviceps digitariae]
MPMLMESQDGQCIRTWFQQRRGDMALLMDLRRRRQAVDEAAAAVAAATVKITKAVMAPSVPPPPSSWIFADRAVSYDMKNPVDYYKPDNIVKVLIPISILGWLAFGAICVLCINGHGRGGRWIPEWYLDSRGTRWDKAAVAGWWMAVMFGWPVILPCVAVSSLSGRIKRWRAERQRRRMEGDDGGGGELSVTDVEGRAL